MSLLSAITWSWTLVSNAIVKEAHAHKREEDPVAPVSRLFDATWRRVDQANKAVKEHVLLHGDTIHHHMGEKLLWFDLLFSTALNSAFVLGARKLDHRVQGDDADYTLAQFGMDVAKLCAEIRKSYGARRHTDKKASFAFGACKVV